jgi:hypothetical protein
MTIHSQKIAGIGHRFALMHGHACKPPQVAIRCGAIYGAFVVLMNLEHQS